MLRPDNVRKDMPLPSKLDHQLMFDILMAPIAHPAVTRKDIEVLTAPLLLLAYSSVGTQFRYRNILCFA